MKQPSKVVFVNDILENLFYSMNENDIIKKALIKAIKSLKEDAFLGIRIRKKQIPKKYIKKYKVTNLWKYNLNKNWRLIYTVIAEDEEKIVCVILDWFDHKKYERTFNYILL